MSHVVSGLMVQKRLPDQRQSCAGFRHVIEVKFRLEMRAT